MTNTFQDFKANPDKDTLLQMWCEFITAMAEDKMSKEVVMERLLRIKGNDFAIIELCGLAPSQLYAQVLAQQENQA
tara:strand:- start:292 stop:519 length:228 start_codon:yes stop_codon:yes gene_type:complete